MKRNDGKEALAEYYTNHRNELLKFVAGRLLSADDAEDIVQDVFLRLLSTDRMISAVTLPCLVYTAVRNRITDYYRRRTLWQGYVGEFSCCGYGEAADAVVSLREVSECMERGLAGLPYSCQEVYRMHIYGGMKTGEISQHIGEGYRSVERRLGIARKRVRQCLAMCV